MVLSGNEVLLAYLWNRKGTPNDQMTSWRKISQSLACRTTVEVFLRQAFTLSGFSSSCGAKCSLLKTCLVVSCSASQDTTNSTLLCVSRQCIYVFTSLLPSKIKRMSNKQCISNSFLFSFFFNFHDAALSRILLIFYILLH